MKAPIKLITQWGGKLPRWFPMFHERISTSRLVDWELIRLSSMEEFNNRVSIAVGYSCQKPERLPGRPPFFALSDVNPLLGHVYQEEFYGYDWWGIVNLDVCFGDLDGWLSPLLDGHDMITISPSPSGTFMLWRNKEEVNGLYRSHEVWKTVLETPEYFNYDEDNFSAGTVGPPLPESYCRLVWRSKLRVHYELNWWDEGRCMERLPSGLDVPSRRFRLREGSLLDVDNGEETLLLHCASKVWPLMPDGSCRYQNKADYADRQGVYAAWRSKYNV